MISFTEYLNEAIEVDLPEDTFRYFTKPAGTVLIPLDKLETTRARSKGIENAAKHMRNSYDGEGTKRAPIDVELMDNGKYKVLDGNSTTAIARAAGWQKIAAIVKQ